MAVVVDIKQLDKDGMRMYTDAGDYIRKGDRRRPRRHVPEFDLKKIEDGLFLAFEGYPPAGEKTKLLWFGFSEAAAKDWAVTKAAYVYQLVYSPSGNPCGTRA